MVGVEDLEAYEAALIVQDGPGCGNLARRLDPEPLQQIPLKLPGDDLIGMRLRLARAAGADTFDQSVHLAAGAILEYTAKEL